MQQHLVVWGDIGTDRKALITIELVEEKGKVIYHAFPQEIVTKELQDKLFTIWKNGGDYIFPEDTLTWEIDSKADNLLPEEIKLHIPIVDDSPTLHFFYHELLENALKENGHIPILITPKLPQLRIKAYLVDGRISIYWQIKSKERNSKFILVNVPLTNGLIGKRILFIKNGAQSYYNKVNTLEDFRNLKSIGMMGKKWFDAGVWKLNNMKYIEESGNWQKIFKLIAKSRGNYYFPRGLNEILEESKSYPDLAIESRLALIYDRDFYFYLSKTGINAGAKFKDTIEHSLKKAKDSGLIEKLVKKYWKNDLKTLQYDKRVKIYLKTPE